MIIPKKLKKKEITYFGYVLVVFGIIFALPQAVKIFQTESAEDVSTVSFAGWTASAFFWIIYGIEKKDTVITIGAIAKLVTNGLVLYGIYLYG